MLAGAGPSRAGRVEGIIHFSGAPTAIPRLQPYAGRLGGQVEAQAPPEPSVRDVAVYLADDAGETAAPDTPPRMEQVGLQFRPRVLAIPIGTTVAFPNLDPVFHNVFSYSPARRFDLGRYGKGKSESVRFDEPGLIKVFCDVHASMSAFILVVDSAHVTQPDAVGHFVLDHVPAGHHRMILWHPEKGEQEVDVVVGEGTTEVEVTY